MGFVYSVVAALCVWIICWALKMKAIDAFLIASVIMIVAAAVRLLVPFSPNTRRR